MSIIGRIIKLIERSSQRERENNNRKLGQEELQNRINRRGRYISLMVIHFILYLSITNLFVKSDIQIVYAGLWGLFVLMPHTGAIILYIFRWSEKELDVFDQEKDSEKAKRKRH